MTGDDGQTEERRLLLELEAKVEDLHVELERKNELLERAEMKALLEIERLKFTQQVTDDIWNWAKRRFWVATIVIAVVSIFGVRFVIEATATKQVFDQILGDTTTVVNDLNLLKDEAADDMLALAAARQEINAEVTALREDVAAVKQSIDRAGEAADLLPALQEQMQRRRQFDVDIADWVFWTKIEVANDRAQLLAQLRERNPEIEWPASVRTRAELSQLRDRKVLVYVTRRPWQTYDERLKLGDDTRDRFIEFGFFAETWVAGRRGARDGNGVDRTVRDDLRAMAAELGIEPDRIIQRCESYCLLTDTRRDYDDLDEIKREVLRGSVASLDPAQDRMEFRLDEDFANIRDYSRAFPATRRVSDEQVLVVVFGDLE